MDNWWLAPSSWQCTQSHILSHKDFFGETSNHPGAAVPPQPRFGALWLLDFPQTKISWKGRDCRWGSQQEILDCGWYSGQKDRAAAGNWENCVRSQGAYFEGDWGVIVLRILHLLVYCIFYNQWFYFSYYMAGYFLGRPCIPKIHLYKLFDMVKTFEVWFKTHSWKVVRKLFFFWLILLIRIRVIWLGRIMKVWSFSLQYFLLLPKYILISCFRPCLCFIVSKIWDWRITFIFKLYIGLSICIFTSSFHFYILGPL